MKTLAKRLYAVLSVAMLIVLPLAGQAADPQKPFTPTSGQPGKDVVWVPTPQELVEQMLNLAKVTSQDVLFDLGSGDGRTVITAAKRGARATGIEYEPNMVELSKKNAADAGVTARATFMKADLFETDFSPATVITLFLLPDINLRLRPKILDLKPGTRIVSNTFTMGDWNADQTATVGAPCMNWCTALLWIVPAKVAGNWQVGSNTLTLDQSFQTVTGRLGTTVLSDGKLNGTEIAFTAGGQKYTGKVDGNSMSGTIAGGGNWTATKK